MDYIGGKEKITNKPKYVQEMMYQRSFVIFAGLQHASQQKSSVSGKPNTVFEHKKQCHAPDKADERHIIFIKLRKTSQKFI